MSIYTNKHKYVSITDKLVQDENEWSKCIEFHQIIDCKQNLYD